MGESSVGRGLLGRQQGWMRHQGESDNCARIDKSFLQNECLGRVIWRTVMNSEEVKETILSGLQPP